MHIDLNDATFPKLLKRNAENFSENKAALRRKGLGIWQSCSWQQYYDNVRRLGLGLHALGFKNGDKLAIIGSNRPESLFAELAAQAAGGVAVSLYQDATSSEVGDDLERFDVSWVIAEDQEQVDKILDQKQRLPKLHRIIYLHKRGLRNYRDELLTSFEALQKQGDELAARQPQLFDSLVTAGQGDNTAIICLTSGTTGQPKGAMLSFKNLISMSIALNEADPGNDTDEFVSLLPLAWFGEQLMSLAAPLVSGSTVNFPEKAETALADLREIGPQIMLSPPKLWESLAATVRVRMMDSTPFKKFMFNSLMPIGEKHADCLLAGQTPPLPLKLSYFFANRLLFSALRDHLGLSRIRSALTGGASLGPETFRFFHAIGVNLKQLYGQTEIAGIACMHRDGGINGSTVGLPLPGTEIRIDDNGEILSRSAGIFQGYYGDQEATSRAMTNNGWLRSGDSGMLDAQGHLTVVDRISGLLTLADGTRLPSQQIENRLRFSPFIAEAIVLGGGNFPLFALIGINSRVVGKWAGDRKLSYMTFADLAAKPEVNELIAGEVARVNQSQSQQARIVRFAIIYKELDADEGELTRNGKVRRQTLEALYADLIGALQTGLEAIEIDKDIVFQDGKSGHIRTTVTIKST